MNKELKLVLCGALLTFVATFISVFMGLAMVGIPVMLSAQGSIIGSLLMAGLTTVNELRKYVDEKKRENENRRRGKNVNLDSFGVDCIDGHNCPPRKSRSLGSSMLTLGLVY